MVTLCWCLYRYLVNTVNHATPQRYYVLLKEAHAPLLSSHWLIGTGHLFHSQCIYVTTTQRGNDGALRSEWFRGGGEGVGPNKTLAKEVWPLPELYPIYSTCST
jgi:hypothetical protein